MNEYRAIEGGAAAAPSATTSSSAAATTDPKVRFYLPNFKF